MSEKKKDAPEADPTKKKKLEVDPDAFKTLTDDEASQVAGGMRKREGAGGATSNNPTGSDGCCGGN